ncbi:MULTISPECIES: SDR family oxidoreductase [Aequorivita]|uniref:SDR family oxidoreductase n=1 Tax=Aequorivita iocasae TaxID=2803865 RepID=A0ABX7DX07_9FLAO|nr:MULTISPECIES: SDR family oxidoreductase [Aequorivita]QQX78128.1 SDR family oxidoreductase [Aequorivita iocasae]UCA57641.1 SDR family oxidoreductase [Aequorivita sp. F7]
MKTILITGASRGIGAATARLAAERGFSVAVNYNKRKEEAEKVVEAIKQKGGHAKAFQADVSKEGDVLRLFEEVDTEFGSLTTLVNNAGILEKQYLLENITSQRWQRIFEANTLSVFLCCREAIKRISPKYGGSGGTIVNVSSIASRTGAPFEYIDYAASKGAVDSLTIGLSRELADENIRVNAVRPAFIHTDIHASGGEPNRIERIKEAIPLKRGGLSSEVAEAILWLATEQSSYSTGIFIDVSGGR